LLDGFLLETEKEKCEVEGMPMIQMVCLVGAWLQNKIQDLIQQVSLYT